MPLAQGLAQEYDCRTRGRGDCLCLVYTNAETEKEVKFWALRLFFRGLELYAQEYGAVTTLLWVCGTDTKTTNNHEVFLNLVS